MAESPQTAQAKPMPTWKRLLLLSAGTGAGFALVLAVVAGTFMWYHGHPASGGGQQTAQQKKLAPSLGFNRVKDVPSIIDQDAFLEENETQRKLPGNEFVKDRRVMHEAAMMNDFLEGIKESKECNGITFYLKEGGKKPAFTVQINVMGHDRHPDDQTWTWILLWPADTSAAGRDGQGMGGMGNQSSAKLTAKDVCLTIWDDVDPNHFKKPGGKIE